jgi:hypothetical protein
LILLTALIFAVLGPTSGVWAQQNRRGDAPAAAPRAMAPRQMAPGERSPYGGPRAYGGYPPPPAYGAPLYAAPYGYPVGARPNAPGFAPEPDWRARQEEARSGVRRGQYAPLGRVIASIRERTPGRQLDTGLEYEGGRAVYRVRWMTPQGRRVDFLVDAASGAILGER